MPNSSQSLNPAAEWLETDGLGGFVSGTVSGIRSRRYHALLLTAINPPTGRITLVNGFEASLETAAGVFALSSQRFAPGVVCGDSLKRLESFTDDPWPRWIFQCEDGTRVQQEIFAVKGRPVTCMAWRLLARKPQARLSVRPFLSGRDYHGLQKSNPVFRFEAERVPGRVSWQTYPGVPGVAALTNGAYAHEPHWYYNFLYEAERERGLDCEEDLAAPGIFSWDLPAGEAVLVWTTREHAQSELATALDAASLLGEFREQERGRRAVFGARLDRAADAYVVKRKCAIGDGAPGKTVIAGYPWFTDWGRDTFIALRGLCLATGRYEEARQILVGWAGAVSQGMLPNRFPDHGEHPEYNSVDASLWYILAAEELLQTGKAGERDREILLGAVEAILEGYHAGTRFQIRADSDGLLAAGERGVQLTWMDAKVGEWVVTPRAGKPVEIQALWLNALRIGAQYQPRWQEPFSLGLQSFRARFWNAAAGCLYDVVDVNHRRGDVDAAFRPNQIFAAGGLPFCLLDRDQAARVVQAVEMRLLTPMGLRSLAPGEPGYTARYEGGVVQRDGAYHQGTVWPWLLGPFVEAWVRVRGGSDAAKREARQRFLDPLLAHLDDAGLGHISEIADAEPPYTPRGCPFQAWSVGEALRLDRVVLAANVPTKSAKTLKRNELAVV